MSSAKRKYHSRRLSMEVIADKTGVSVATVSRVLNNKPGISEKIRSKVNTALKECGYRRRKSKNNIPNDNLHSIAFAVSDDLLERIDNGSEFYGRHLIAVQRAITDAGYYPMLVNRKKDSDSDGMLRCVKKKQVQAVIAESWSMDLVHAVAKEVPVVLFNRVHTWGSQYKAVNVDTVTTNMHSAAQTQLEYLYDLGHRCIAQFRISEPYCFGEVSCFWQQYFSFAKAKNLLLPNEVLMPIQFGRYEEIKTIRTFVERILRANPRPTAIMSYDTYMPILFDILEKMKVRVPEEMSLMGFNDLQIATELPVPLTTYRQRFDILAQEAVRLILDKMGHPSEQGRLVQIQGTLVERQSCAAVPG